MKKGLFVTTRHTSAVDPTGATNDRAYRAFSLSRSFRVLPEWPTSEPAHASRNRKKVVLLGFGAKRNRGQQQALRLGERQHRRRRGRRVRRDHEDEEDRDGRYTGLDAACGGHRRRNRRARHEGGRLVRPKVPPWVPSAVIDAIKRRSACHSCAASVFEVDLDAGSAPPRHDGSPARDATRTVRDPRGFSHAVDRSEGFFYAELDANERGFADVRPLPRQECTPPCPAAYAVHPRPARVSARHRHGASARGQTPETARPGPVSTRWRARTPACATGGPPRAGFESVQTRPGRRRAAEPRAVCIARVARTRATRWWGGRRDASPPERPRGCCTATPREGAPARFGAGTSPPTCARRETRDWMARRAKTHEHGSGQAAQSVISLRLEESPWPKTRDRLWTSSRRPTCNCRARAVQPRRRFQRGRWGRCRCMPSRTGRARCAVNARGAYEPPAA